MKICWMFVILPRMNFFSLKIYAFFLAYYYPPNIKTYKYIVFTTLLTAAQQQQKFSTGPHQDSRNDNFYKGSFITCFLLLIHQSNSPICYELCTLLICWCQKTMTTVSSDHRLIVRPSKALPVVVMTSVLVDGHNLAIIRKGLNRWPA